MSVVGGGNGGGPGNSGIWRRERIVMADADTDDVAFLTGRKLSRMYQKRFFIAKITFL